MTIAQKQVKVHNANIVFVVSVRSNYHARLCKALTLKLRTKKKKAIDIHYFPTKLEN